MKLLPPGLSSKYVVIYPSVGLEGEDDGNDFSGDPGSSVLFVGRLVQRKGVDVLISSLREVLQTVPDASLAVVGEGPEKEKLSAMARDLGISDRVSFLGILQGRELGEIFKESDVVVMPSRSGADDVEGFGTSLIEAGLFKKPVIGSKSGGIPEAVVDGVTGLLVPEDDSHALATALVDLLTDTRLREKMGEASYQRVKSEFRVEKAVSLLESALGS